jgi:hypothetical protein
MHKDQVKADQRYRAKQDALGNIRISVLVPADKAEELKSTAAKMRQQSKRDSEL